MQHSSVRVLLPEEQEPAESCAPMQSMQSYAYAPGVVPEDSLQSAGVQHSSVRVLLPEEQSLIGMAQSTLQLRKEPPLIE